MVMGEVIRKVMKLLAMVFFMGYMVLWVMIPTDTYYFHWFPTINAKAHSIFFGDQGGSLLIYTLPILFIAAVGCLCLHFKHRENGPSLSAWKKPAIVKGPLGIVSFIELTFLTMFATLLVWSFASYVRSLFPNAPSEAAKSHINPWEQKLGSSALLLGLVGHVCLAFLFFPVTRASSVLGLIGLTSESSIKYHIWLGHTAMVLFTAHGCCYIIFWVNTNQISQMLKWEKVGGSNLAGEITLLAGLAMWATTLPKIRRKLFELFFYTHHLYILFVVFFVFHVGFSTACIILPGIYLFAIDRYLRFLQSRQKIRLASARLLPCRAVELNFSKNPGLSYTPTSTIFVNIPTVSRFQWHPFTVTSSSNLESDKLSVVIKSGGSWSSTLYEKLASGSVKERLEVSLEGPYGPASTNFNKHDMLVMISGGSGITPLISITRELLFIANKTTKPKMPRLLLVCAFKTTQDLSMLDVLLPMSGTLLDISCLDIHIEAYVTTQNDEPKPSPIKTIHFKPDIRDVPVSAALGSNSWLWLGLIIASSFVMFLLFIGIITRYYIHPKEHDYAAYPDSSRSVLYLMFLCVAIASTATAAFLWNNRKSAGEIQNSMASPDPTMLSDAAVELESLPHQNLSHATRFHRGKRPDLKKILLDCKGSSIGVLVSGPRKMRQEAAAICSSGLANNLHFESISFTW